MMRTVCGLPPREDEAAARGAAEGASRERDGVDDEDEERRMRKKWKGPKEAGNVRAGTGSPAASGTDGQRYHTCAHASLHHRCAPGAPDKIAAFSRASRAARRRRIVAE
jgi:hypothetical protein